MSTPEAPVQPPADAAPAAEPAWSRWIGIAVFASAVLVGGWLRFRDLDLKPLHSDEGVNGWFLMRLFDGLRDTGNWRVNYRYDPTNYHGPFLYFAGLIPFFGFGPSNTTLRVLMAVAGTGCIGVLWAARRWLGWAGLALVAWLVAVSPPLVYFSRTAIHEIYVAFFTLAAVICFARCYAGAWKPGEPTFRANWLLFGIVSAGLLFTNKETAAITFASFVGAAFIAWFLSRSSPEESIPLSKAEKKREKEKGAGERPGGLAKAIRFAAAAAIGLGPALILLKFVPRKGLSLSYLPFEQKVWIAVGSLFGLASAIAWVAGTRGETFRLPARVRRARELLRYALGGVLFVVFGPVFLVRWIVDRVPFLAGIRPGVRGFATALEKRLPASFDDLSDYALAYAWGIAVVVILFTSFFNNLRGAIDMFATYLTWVGRGHEGAGHEKPFGYWIELLWEFDAPILLMGMLGTVVALYRRDRFGLFVASWAWSQWLVYSVISYKTPWLNLNFTLPLAVTGGLVLREIAGGAGSAIATIAKALVPSRPAAPWVAASALTVAMPALVVAWPVPAGPVLAPKDKDASVRWWDLSWDVNFVHYDDDRYAIIYVQTVREFEELIARMQTLLEKHGDKLSVWVTSGDYWPMPFYLRDWDKMVGYHQGKIPAGTTASVVVAASTQEAELRERVEGYRRVPFMLRPGVALALYVEPSVWDPTFGPPAGEAPPEPPPDDPALRAAGFVAEYRYGIGCTGEVLARRVDPLPRYGNGEREFRAPLCVTWKGFLDVKEGGEYAFGSSSDDGSWIYVDGKLVLDNGGTHGRVDREGVLQHLAPGLHPVEVRYFDAGGGASLDVWVRKRDGRTRLSLDALGGVVHDRRWLEGPIQKAELSP